MEEIIETKKEIKRPWQGTLRIFLEIPFCLFHAVVLVCIFGLFKIGVDKEFLFVGCIISLVIIFGFSRGIKNIVIFSLTFYFFSVISILIMYFYTYYNKVGKAFKSDIDFLMLVLPVYLLSLYLSYKCLKHPFYNQKINKT